MSWQLPGRQVHAGWDVFLICSLSLCGLSPPSVPLPPLLLLWRLFSLHAFQRFISFSYLYPCTPSHFSPSNSAFPFVFVSLLCLPCLCLSALCPVAEGFRLGPSSVSGKVALQLAACPIRGLSLLGHVTHTSAPPLPLLQHNALAGSQLLDRHLKVNSRGSKIQIHPV